eukprot:TRINITY_DN5297_c0_g1_i1.p1 TRINITY_DN5297_c0_g1~~TRINITY_DN5297_c0_g1_i1.p1  ORF type:complete len:663 (-),score=188.52 TRINITY_DN5297_c0_g1_i1:38-2026(-)
MKVKPEENQKEDEKFSRKKECISCGTLIPTKAFRCFSCHVDQPIDLSAFARSGNKSIAKKNKSYKLVKFDIMDEEDLAAGVVFSTMVYKIYDKDISNYLQSFVSLAPNGKKKSMYCTLVSLIVALPKLRAYVQTAKGLPGTFKSFLENVEENEKKMVEDIKKLTSRGKIVFEGLWYLFEKGCNVFSWRDGHQLGGIVKTADYSAGFCFVSGFNVSVTSIKYNGDCFYYYDDRMSINAFEGVEKIEDLTVQLITPEVMKALSTRGEKFVKLVKTPLGHSYKQYRGAMMRQGGMFSYKVKADGRIMIDIATFNRMNPNVYEFAYATNSAPGHRGGRAGRAMDEAMIDEVGSDELFMTWHCLPGFSFACKQWGYFFVNNISDIIFDDQAFHRLVLPTDKKVLIRALVEEHGKQMAMEEQKAFTDIISGKGGGCIFLLHGTPGVGKTLTAEAVSEHLHTPLYSVTVGELGTTPESLETQLQKILELAGTWRASILLDEADIFLEKRSKKDIVRNAMVGIFLRLLEYHQGVLFLTTNRITCLDEAFSSRISVALHYDELDRNARAQVWRNFLQVAEGDEACAKLDFEELAAHQLNGRQIRSSVKLSQALARSQNVPLSMDHLRVTIGVASNFKTQFMQFKKEKRDKKTTSKRDRVKTLIEPATSETK